MAQINFPNFPIDGEKFTLNGEVWVYNESKNHWIKNLQTDNSVDIVFPELPTKVSQLENDSGYLNSITEAQIVGTLGYQPADSLSGLSTNTYANESSFPTTGNSLGDIVFSIESKRLFFWDGSKFVAIGYVNDAPVVSGLQSSYEIDSFNTSESIELLINELQNQDTTITVNQVSNSWNVSISAPLGETSLYYMSGRAVNGINGTNPDIIMYVGDTITFDVYAPNNPVYIKTANSTGTGNQAPGVINNGTEDGTIIFTPTSIGTYYYNSRYNTNMDGQILVRARPSNILNPVIDENTITFTPSSAETGVETFNITVSDGQASTVLNTQFNITYALKYPSNLRVRNTAYSFADINLAYAIAGSNINPVLKNYGGGREYAGSSVYNLLYGVDTNPQTSSFNTGIDLNTGAIESNDISSSDFKLLSELAHAAWHLNYPYFVEMSGTNSFRLNTLTKSSDSLTYADEKTLLTSLSTSTYGRHMQAIIQRNGVAYSLLGNNVYNWDTGLLTTYSSSKPSFSQADLSYFGTPMVNSDGVDIRDGYYIGDYRDNKNSIVVNQRWIIAQILAENNLASNSLIGRNLIAIHDTEKSSTSLFDMENFPNLGYIVPVYNMSNETISNDYRFGMPFPVYFGQSWFGVTDDLNYIVVLGGSDLLVYDWSNKSNAPVHVTTYFLDNDFPQISALFYGSQERHAKALHIDNNIIYISNIHEICSYQINNGNVEKLGHVLFPNQAVSPGGVQIGQYKEYLWVTEPLNHDLVAFIDSTALGSGY